MGVEGRAIPDAFSDEPLDIFTDMRSDFDPECPFTQYTDVDSIRYYMCITSQNKTGFYVDQHLRCRYRQHALSIRAWLTRPHFK